MPGNGGELHKENTMQELITVLIADDNVHMRETLRIMLNALEFIALAGEASNGEEAIQMAAELKPHVLLMDINMSPVNGFEATRKILKQNPSIKIIALSLHKEVSYCRNMFRLGARGYVSKSSSYAEILEAIKEVAGGGKYVDKSIVGFL
jgi:DNA-binding NarL/FixJ family response regulator